MLTLQTHITDWEDILIYVSTHVWVFSDWYIYI